jgi:hypothetical protein
MSPTLAMFDPTTFPITIPLAPWKDAVREEASSGTEVPTETRVSPIMNSETPSFFAIEEEDITNKSEPLTRRQSPATRRRTLTASTGKEVNSGLFKSIFFYRNYFRELCSRTIFENYFRELFSRTIFENYFRELFSRTIMEETFFIF